MAPIWRTLALRAALAGATLSPAALGARVSTEEASQLPWRKLAAIGAIGAHGLSRHAAAAIPDEVREAADEEALNPDLYDRIRLALVDGMDKSGGDTRATDVAVGKLLNNFRRKYIVFPGRAKELDKDLQANGLVHRLDSSAEFPHDAPLALDQYEIRHEDGSSAAIIKRYSAARQQRKPGEVKALQNMLRNMRRTKGHFLRLYSSSHTAKSLGGDEAQNEEVLLMFEPFQGTLREYFRRHVLSVDERLRLFLQVNRAVEKLKRRRIPHSPVVSQDNVLVVGDPKKGSVKAVLCPSILTTDLEVCSFQRNLWSWITKTELPESVLRPNELYKLDVEQLGSLLEWMMAQAPTDEELLDLEDFVEALEFAKFAQPMKERGAHWPIGILKMVQRRKKHRWLFHGWVKSYEDDIREIAIRLARDRSIGEARPGQTAEAEKEKEENEVEQEEQVEEAKEDMEEETEEEEKEEEAEEEDGGPLKGDGV